MPTKYPFEKSVARFNRYQKFINSCWALENNEGERAFNQLLIENQLPLETWIPNDEILPEDEEIIKNTLLRLQNEFLTDEEVEAAIHLLDSIYDLDYTYLIAGIPLATANQDDITTELLAFVAKKK